MNRVFLCIILTIVASSLISAQNFWQPVNNGLTDPFVRAIVVKNTGTIFTGTEAGAFRSTNHGDNWSLLSATNGVTVQTMWIDAAQRIYGGTEHGVFVSTDDGNSWSHLNNGFPDTLVLAITMNESDHVFAGTDLGGLYRSTNLGANWTKLTNGLTSDNITVLANLGGGITLAGTDGQGMYRSTNNGDSWSAANGGITDLYLRAIAKKTGGIVFVGTNIGGVFRSNDFGQTWTEVNTNLTTLSIASLVVHPNGDVYVGTSGGGVFRSTNNGGSWSEVNSGLTNLFVYALAVDSSKYIFAGTAGDGDFRSIQPVTTAIHEDLVQAISYSLEQNYPNPFNPRTRLRFVIQNSSIVTLSVYNILGNTVATLVDGKRISEGSHEINFDASGLASGVYYYRLVAQTERSGETFVSVKKMVVMK